MPFPAKTANRQLIEMGIAPETGFNVKRQAALKRKPPIFSAPDIKNFGGRLPRSPGLKAQSVCNLTHTCKSIVTMSLFLVLEPHRQPPERIFAQHTIFNLICKRILFFQLDRLAHCRYYAVPGIGSASGRRNGRPAAGYLRRIFARTKDAICVRPDSQL